MKEFAIDVLLGVLFKFAGNHLITLFYYLKNLVKSSKQSAKNETLSIYFKGETKKTGEPSFKNNGDFDPYLLLFSGTEVSDVIYFKNMKTDCNSVYISDQGLYESLNINPNRLKDSITRMELFLGMYQPKNDKTPKLFDLFESLTIDFMAKITSKKIATIDVLEIDDIETTQSVKICTFKKKKDTWKIINNSQAMSGTIKDYLSVQKTRDTLYSQNLCAT